MAKDLRVASFNASMNRGSEAGLILDLATGEDSQAQAIADIIQKTDADIILINEFDYDSAGEAAALFRSDYLEVGQNGASPIDYPYFYAAPSNTGILSGFDLNNDGTVATEADRGSFGYANDSQGFGQFPGQFSFVIYSKHPIDEDGIRSFQNFLWKDMPGNLLTDGEGDPALDAFYSAEEIDVLRLSSKNHVDLPVIVDGEVVHVLAAHPTPPVFDGAEDRNGKRNHDEIRFWADYVDGADYIYDDAGTFGGLAPDARFVIAGDYNADPFDGDSFDGAINQLVNNPAIIASATDPAITPDGEGSVEVGPSGFNATHLGDPAFDTGDFGFNSDNPAEDNSPGNLRVDYVLPSAQGFAFLDGGVFWPESSDPDFALTSFPTSDHRLVYADLRMTDQNRNTVEDLAFIGENTIPDENGDGTRLGGLSGITYDPSTGLFYAVSDDRGAGDDGTPRFYTLDINLSDGSLDAGDVSVAGVTALTLEDGVTTWDTINPDPEGIAIGQSGLLYISSERNADGLNPQIFLVDSPGKKIGELPVDDKFNGDGETKGVRNNLGFESLAISPDQTTLWTATESALVQDSDRSTVDTSSAARIVKYDVESGEAVAEYIYEVDPIANEPIPADAFADSGLVELLALDNQGTLLALERSFSIGAPEKGYTGKLYLVRTQGATNVIDQDSVPTSVDEDGELDINVDEIAVKELLLDLGDAGIVPDNIEGMTLGPVLPDGRQSLVIVSDDNFDAFGPQDNQVLAFALELGEIPTITPILETPEELRYEDATDLTEGSDPDDPAIWENEFRASKSLVITTMKNGGLRSYNLEGEEVQRIEPEGVRYNNVDIVYGVELRGKTYDLAVVSDRENDTLEIFRINPFNGRLVNVTSKKAPESIFGVDDGEATAYGLAGYTAPDGTAYAFVTQADSASIAQLELVVQGSRVTWEKVRELNLPVPEGEDPADYQSEGIVVDRDTGTVYVGVEEELGLLAFDADPASVGEFRTVADFDSGYFKADIEGVAIHYEEDGNGLIVASSQGDATFAVFDRATEEYRGSFAIRGDEDVDGVEESDGLDIFSGSLPGFENGLLVTHDGSNEPEVVFGDPEDGEIQNYSVNFKYTDLGDVLDLFDDVGAPVDPGSDLLVETVAILDSGSGGDGAEVVNVFDGRAYVTNGEDDQLDIFDMATGEKVSAIDLTELPGYDGVNSVSVSDAGIAVAVERDNATEPSPSMLVGENGWSAHPILTVGASLDNGYTPPGIMDGIGAMELDENTVRIYVNHELVSFDGYAFEVDGIELTGSRISYFDIDKETKSIIDGGQAIKKIVGADGAVATDTSFTFENLPGFTRFCSGVMVEGDTFGNGEGIVDPIYFAGEETGGNFSDVGGGEWALDTATGTIYALPDFGRGAWENVTQVRTGNSDKTAFILADDTSPFDADGDGENEAAPLFLYVGDKSSDPDAGFLERNGLKDGQLYVWVPKPILNPGDFSGEGLAGTWVEVDNTPRLDLADEFGAKGYDEFGYPTQSNLWAQAEALGAFQFSRPEDVATNPANGFEFTMASTGVDTFAVDPVTGNGADTFGTIYTMELAFDGDGSPIGGDLKVVYDGDADPTRALRSPDNLDWADDGKIYVQEDRAEADTLSGDEILFGEGATNPNDASIVALSPDTGTVERVAVIDQTQIAPTDATDENVAASGSIDVGDWESSGILDVSTLFGEAPGTLFLADVQAHALDDQDRFDPTGPAALITDDTLKEGGQLSFLAGPELDITVDAPLDPEYAQNGIVALYDFDGSLLDTYEVGNLPDMVTFSKDGTQIFVANEGENQGDIDPAGSISVIDLATDAVTTTGFEAFDAVADDLVAAGVRLFPGETPSTDFEPEYIAEGGGLLYVALQEANALGVYDLGSASFTDILPLGTLDHSIEGQGLDPSDKDDEIDIQTAPVQGLRMPDAIATVEISGDVYILTANEGDARDADERIEDLTLDPTAFPDAEALQAKKELGRLEVSTIDGDTDGDGDFDALFSYGSRSFTIYDTSGNVVFDSGDGFEQKIAEIRPANAFNNQDFPSDAPDVVDENRSDNKGPEPEAIETGVIGDETFAFIGLERDSGVMIYNITDPANAEFAAYIEGNGNVSPEIISFVPATESLTGSDQIVVSYEVSGTTAIYDLDIA